METARQIGILIGLTLLSGVFAAAEIALLSVRKTRLEELSAHRRGARAALALRNSPERLLATVQVGITVLGALTGAFGGIKLAEPLGRALERLGAGPWAAEVSLALVVALVSFLGIVLGELVPKSLALKSSESVALLLAPFVSVVATATRPAVWVLTWTSNLVLRPFRDQTTFAESRMSPEELQQLVEDAANSGSLNQEAGDIASRAIDLGALKLSAVMVPRTAIIGVRVEATRDEILKLLRRHPHTRYPIITGPDVEVNGYVVARDLYAALLEGEVNVLELKRNVPFLPEAIPVVQGLRQLQAARTPLGIVVDESGGVAGLVTIEDIAEELLGDILAEHEAPTFLVQAEADGSARISGSAPVHEVNRALGLELPERPGYTTMAGLVLDRAQRIPDTGDVVELSPGIEAHILEANPRTVRWIRLRFAPERSDD